MKALSGCLIGLAFVVSASAEPLLEGRVRLDSGEPVADAQVRIFDLADLRQGAIARAMTDGTGYFALPLAALAGRALPARFALGPNYPNPFNPSTIIPYQLAASAVVRLEVFNLLGQHIATLVDGERAAGFHTATWHAVDGVGRAVGAGVYIYRMTVGMESQTGRMVLLDGQAGLAVGGTASVMPGVSGVSGSNGANGQVYGLVVSGSGLVPYVDSSFRVESGMAPVELVVSSGQHSAGKVTDDDCAFCDLFGAFNDEEEEGDETTEEETDSTSSKGGPDLIVQSPSVSTVTLTPGQAFTLQVTVHNQGDAQAAATMLHYYRSNNSTITASDTEVGTDGIGTLDASATSAESIELTAPTGGALGVYYGACVASVSGESNTDNNCSSAVKITVSGQEATEDEGSDTSVTIPDANLRAEIEITPIGRGVSVTSENQILVELEPGDVVPANPFDLAGRTLVFTPDGRGGYSREVRPLDWDPSDRGERHVRPVEIELKHFQFDFSGRKWRSFFLSGTGLITFGETFPFRGYGRTAARFGTMRMIADAMVVTPTISALYKPYLGGNIYVSDLPDRVVTTFYAWDYELTVYGRRPKETFDYQIVLHSDGRVAFNYGPDPVDADEAFRDGIVGLFPTDLTTGVIPRIPDRTGDLSRPDSRFSAVQVEVFRYPAIRDRGEGVADVSCRIIEVLGDEFAFFAFNSQSRFDIQEAGPAHGFAGFYGGNILDEVEGIGLRGKNRTPCKSRLKNSWGFPVWMKASTVVNEAYTNDGHHTPYDNGLTVFAHEIGHTWLAFASYLVNGERMPMQVNSGGSHWALELHAPAPFSWDGAETGSVMGGAFWRENPDGTFTATSGWTTKGGGFSWLDLYLMGLATPDEVPDMFILRNLRREGPCTAEAWECERFGPFAADKGIVTIEQIVSAIGPRNPPTERARKIFNIGFVYFLLPGQTSDPELLREHANYRDRALDHWSHVTGGRGQLTTELP